MASTTIDITINGNRRSVSVERSPSQPGRFLVSWDDSIRVVDAQKLDQDVWSLLMPETGFVSHRVRCVDVDSDNVRLHINDIVLDASVDNNRQKFLSRAGASSVTDDSAQIVAPMPGKVVRILVKPNEEIKAHQPVIVVEAMKMENELSSGRDGRVSKIIVEEGDSVEAGKILVVIE
ncbi:MAG: hypothetical protein CMM58_13665 [Rhodospirillaceae bacterium]|nr:hypothetical protein [Rhodospirillaceae bacterium]|tara:strand:- start:1612 stop:2142 length:531 start_codon:yes stop_codon:yes gene_type:complete